MKSNLSELDKKTIIEAYDNTCDKLFHTSTLLDEKKGTLGQKLKLGKSILTSPFRSESYKLHREHIGNILTKTIGYNKDGEFYIENPDFVVNEFLHNPTNKNDILVPTSIEQSIYIGKLMEHYFDVQPEEIAKNNNIDEFKGYLDKGLIALALRIRKIMIAPGKYKILEEIVPVSTTVYNEMLNKLINSYYHEVGKYPNQDDINHLKSIAMAQVCDEEYTNGKIIKKDSTKALNTMISSIIKSQKSIYINDWNKYHDQVFRQYGVKWEDNYYDIQGHNQNIWINRGDIHFDNRPLEQGKIITLKKQSKKF